MVISKDFIYGVTDYYESAYLQNLRDIDRIMQDYEARLAQKNILTGFGMFAESYDDAFMEAAIVDAVKKLGEKIIEIIKKFKQFISDCVGRIRGTKLKRQALGKDMTRLEAKNPELAAKVKVAINAGDINFATMKGISEYYKEIDKILDDIENNKVDPKSFKGRLERAKKCIINNKETVTAIGAFLGVVSTGSIIYINWSKHHRTIEQENAEMQNVIRESTKRLERTQKYIDRLQSLPPDKQPHTILGYYANVVNDIDYTSKLQITGREKFMNKVAAKMDNAIGKIFNKLGIKYDFVNKQDKKLRGKAIRETGILVNSMDSARKYNDAVEASKSTIDRAIKQKDYIHAISREEIDKQQKKINDLKYKSGLTMRKIQKDQAILNLDEAQRRKKLATKQEHKLDVDTELAERKIEELKKQRDSTNYQSNNGSHHKDERYNNKRRNNHRKNNNGGKKK